MKKFTSALCLLMTLTMGATKVKADDNLTFLLLLLTTTFAVGSQNTYAAESLIDEAYAGKGEKLEAIALNSDRSVEEVAEIIVALDSEGKISASNAEEMAHQIDQALN